MTVRTARTVALWTLALQILALIALALASLAAHAQTPEPCAADKVCLSWSATTRDTAGVTITEPVTYTVYSGTSATVVTTTTTLAAVVNAIPGNNCFTVTARTAIRGESARTAQACKSYVPAPPEAPANFSAR